MDSKRSPCPFDLRRHQCFLSRLSRFRTVESWSPSGESVAGQHDPPLRRSSPRLPGRRARLSIGHVSSHSPFGRCDVVRIVTVPRPCHRRQAHRILPEDTGASLRSDGQSPSPCMLFHSTYVFYCSSQSLFPMPEERLIRWTMSLSTKNADCNGI